MSLEGRKFYFARDDEGKIFAEFEIESEVANREGWLLPPRKGERIIEILDAQFGKKTIKLVWEATGTLENHFPVYALLVSECDFASMIFREPFEARKNNPKF